MFNEICINEEMLPKYTYIYIYIYVGSGEVDKHLVNVRIIFFELLVLEI